MLPKSLRRRHCPTESCDSFISRVAQLSKDLERPKCQGRWLVKIKLFHFSSSSTDLQTPVAVHLRAFCCEAPKAAVMHRSWLKKKRKKRLKKYKKKAHQKITQTINMIGLDFSTETFRLSEEVEESVLGGYSDGFQKYEKNRFRDTAFFFNNIENLKSASGADRPTRSNSTI